MRSGFAGGSEQWSLVATVQLIQHIYYIPKLYFDYEGSFVAEGSISVWELGVCSFR